VSDPFVKYDCQRELAHRVSGGLEVTLYWNVDDNSTSVEIFDAATEVTLHVTVARERALDAFNHPFAHLWTMSDEAAFVRELRA
jgi:hypothetical protein